MAIVKKLVKTDLRNFPNKEKGFIEAGQLPDKNLNFKNVFHDGDFKYTIVEGNDVDIQKWMTRVGAIEFSSVELNSLAKPKVEVERKCFNCGQLYTQKWVNIVL